MHRPAAGWYARFYRRTTVARTSALRSHGRRERFWTRPQLGRPCEFPACRGILRHRRILRSLGDDEASRCALHLIGRSRLGGRLIQTLIDHSTTHLQKKVRHICRPVHRLMFAHSSVHHDSSQTLQVLWIVDEDGRVPVVSAFGGQVCACFRAAH